MTFIHFDLSNSEERFQNLEDALKMQKEAKSSIGDYIEEITKNLGINFVYYKN